MHLLFDIGGTNTRIAKTLDGKILESVRIIPTNQDFEQHIQSITEAVKEISGSDEIESAVCAVAGSLNPQQEVLISSPNLQGWVQRPFKEELEFNLDCPVYLENDAHLGGLGEACFGAAKEYKNVAFITIGTGIGGARILNKQIEKNTYGFEPGHQVINLEGGNCKCGGMGHLEAFVAGAYLKQLYGSAGEELTHAPAWEEIAKILAAGVNNTIVHWSPDVVVLSGSVMQKISLDSVSTHLNKFLKVLPQPPIIKGILGHEAGLYGGLKIIQSLSDQNL